MLSAIRTERGTENGENWERRCNVFSNRNREMASIRSRIGENMSSSYWNEEDDENIICPYCGKEYEPSYEDTYIGNDCVNCCTEDTNTYTCEKCGKKFTMYG